MPDDSFQLRYGDEIRQALIVLERNSGACELLGHGSLPDRPGSEPALYAVVRSGDTGAVYLLVRAGNPAPGRAGWHEVSAADLPHFRPARPHAA
jgi:hypothetical protein